MTQTSRIDTLIQKERTELANLKKKIVKGNIRINISPEQCIELLKINLNKIIAERNIDKSFLLTENNIPLMKDLYYYFVGDKDKFSGDISKGIMLVGKNGVGKTIIMKAYCNIIKTTTMKVISEIHSKTLARKIKEGEIDYYIKRPLFIDDLGKEAMEINTFGNKIQPIVDLIAFRYDNGAQTFATCNYNNETLSKFYGSTTVDRFSEMFNVIKLNGESFR